MWEAGAPKSHHTHYRASNVVGNNIKPVTRMNRQQAFPAFKLLFTISLM
jgi:hypothetical protein